MTSRPGPAGPASRDKLLDAAERLVAVRGLAVSNREICLAAQHRNNSAIAYHFGSRQGLLDAVWERRTQTVNRHRAELISRLSQRQRTDVSQLTRTYVYPLADEVASRVPGYWARFNQQWLSTMPLDFLATFREDLAAHPEDVPLRTLLLLYEWLGSTLTHLPAATRGQRVALMSRFVITALASWERDAEVGARPVTSMGDFSADLQQTATAVLLAPASAGVGT